MRHFSLLVATIIGVHGAPALAQGDQVRATTPDSATPLTDGGTPAVQNAPGAMSWNDTRPNGNDAKFNDTKAVLDKKPEEKPKAAILKFGEVGEIEFYQAVQIWTDYTMNAQASADGSRPLTYVDDRADLFIRRGRVGFRGKFGAKNSFNIVFAYDGLGKDQHNAVRGGNNLNNLAFSPFDLQWTFQAHPTWANVTIGHFRPQIGRESITGAFVVNSFEKSGVQNYQRAHIVGRTLAGRETGVNIGGLFNGSGWGLNYNFGMFDTSHTTHVGAFSDRWSPLLAGRVVLSLGDPELEKHALSYTVNYWGKRTGISLAVQATTQGRTDVFERNNLLGFDVLANWRGLNFTTEFHILGRNVFGVRSVNHIGFARAGYQLELGGLHFEPTVMYTEARGSSTYLFTGRDRLFEGSINWYLDRNNMKLTAAYSKNLVTLDEGGTSDFTDQRRFVRGDFVALGVQYLY